MSIKPRPARITLEIGREVETAIDLARRHARQTRPGFVRAVIVQALEDRGVLQPATSEASR